MFGTGEPASLYRIESDGDHQIGLLMRLGHEVAAGVGQHAGVTRVVFRQHAFGHGCQHGGQSVFADKLRDQRAHVHPQR